jgi:hypothetical protein
VRLFTSAAFTHHHATVGVKRYFANSYIQNQLTFGIETIHNNGLFSKISAILGEPLENKLVTRKSLSGSLRMQAWGKPLMTSAGYSAAKGRKLFGVDWDEKTASFNVTYQLFSSVILGVGYTITDSTIDYYDVSEPNFKLRLTAIELKKLYYEKNKFFRAHVGCLGHLTGVFTIKPRCRKTWQQSIYPDPSSRQRVSWPWRRKN